jgi:hypothetical protein
MGPAIARRGHHFMSALVVVNGDAILLQIIAAATAAGRFTGGLDGGQEQGHQDANDGDDDEQLDEGKPRRPNEVPLHVMTPMIASDC